MGDQDKLRRVFLFVLALLISALFFQLIRGFIMAILLAAIFAGLATPTYERVLRLLRGRRKTAASLTLLLSLVLVITPLMVLMIVVAREAAEVIRSAGPWLQRQLQPTSAWMQSFEGIPLVEKLAPYQDEVVSKVGELGRKAASFAMSSVAAGTRGTARFFLLLFVMLYAMFFFLMQGGKNLRRVLRFVPLSDAEQDRMLETFTTVTRATLKGTGIIGIVQGALGGLSFAVAGVPGPVFWGVVMAVLSVIPAVGPAVVWVPVVIYLAVEGQTIAAVGVGLWCILVVSTVDNLLRPRLVGKDTQMPDLLVLLSTLGGLAMFGAVGIIVGPVIAALFVAIWAIVGTAIEESREREEQAGEGDNG